MVLLVRRPDAARRDWRGLGFLFGGGGGRGEARVSDSGAPNPDFSILGRCAAARGAQTLLGPRQRIGPAIKRTNTKEAIRGAATTRGLGGQCFSLNRVPRIRQGGGRHVPGQESIVVVKLRSHFRTFSISGRTRAFATVRDLHRANSVDICRWSEIVGDCRRLSEIVGDCRRLKLRQSPTKRHSGPCGRFHAKHRIGRTAP